MFVRSPDIFQNNNSNFYAQSGGRKDSSGLLAIYVRRDLFTYGRVYLATCRATDWHDPARWPRWSATLFNVGKKKKEQAQNNTLGLHVMYY